MFDKKLNCILAVIVIAGCEPSMDNETTPKYATKVLKENFYNNKNNFYEMVDIYRKNPEITLEHGKCLSFDGESEILSELCKMQQDSRVISWGKDEVNKSMTFYTFESRNDDYWNGFLYRYMESELNKTMPICETKFLANEKDEDVCLHQLDGHWYLEHRYYSMKLLKQ